MVHEIENISDALQAQSEDLLACRQYIKSKHPLAHVFLQFSLA